MNNVKNKLIEDYEKALKLVKQKRVKKYVFKPSNIERWVVEGKSGRYLILPNLFCQCEDFYISVVIKKKRKRCYHLLAQTIAEQFKKYNEIIMKDEEYSNFMRKLSIKY